MEQKNEKTKNQKLLGYALIFLSLVMLLSVLPVHGEAKLYDSVLRLHVLANSDSDEDQADKLAVRDAILSYLEPLMSGCKSREEAVAVVNAHTDDLVSVSEKTLLERGSGQSVTVKLGNETYPERDYGEVCFPSGEYLSLRVCIGNAEGKNWWCCLFPSLCLGAAGAKSGSASDAFVAAGMTPSQYKIVTETNNPIYKIRFKILELFS